MTFRGHSILRIFVAQMAMDLYTTIEVASVLLSLIFLILLIRENKWCWPFGIASSALSIALFIHIRLYSEAVLYAFYVAIGVYGWWVWTRNKPANDGEEGVQTLPIIRLSFAKSFVALACGVAGAFGLGYFFWRYTDAAKPAIDATTTSFSFVASFLEAHKVLSSWIYWILINGVSVWLYWNRGLELYSLLMVVYFAVSIYGLITWRNRYRTQLAA